jgi:hypothetical protein
MRKTVDLPTELWMDILKTLAFPDLKLISLACKRFRALAAPRLFRRLCLTMFSYRGGCNWSYSGTDYHDVRKLVFPSDQYLEFYGSEKIAPLVREFRLCKYSYKHLIEPGIEVVLALLRRLPGLESITFRSCNLDAQVMHALEQLPALASISMIFCSGPTTHIPHLRLKKVELVDIRRWLFTPDPDSLECLSIGNCEPPAASCLPNLRTLSVNTYHWPSVFCCLDFLVKCSCPSLETLSLSSTVREYELPANIDGLPTIPRLQNFAGPIRLAPIFATGRSLLHVILSEERGPFVTVDVLHELLLLAPNLVTLMVIVRYVKESVLRAAFSFLHLEELRLQSTSDEKISVKACRRPGQPAHGLISDHFPCHHYVGPLLSLAQITSSPGFAPSRIRNLLS